MDCSHRFIGNFAEDPGRENIVFVANPLEATFAGTLKVPSVLEAEGGNLFHVCQVDYQPVIFTRRGAKVVKGGVQEMKLGWGRKGMLGEFSPFSRGRVSVSRGT
jgi:hypothetical protein